MNSTSPVLNEAVRIQAAHCPFCEATLNATPDPSISGGVEVASRLIRSTRHANLVVSITPIAFGHMMVTPRRHVRSISALSTDELQDVLGLSDAAIATANSVAGSYVVFEHGIAENKTGGCGVDHAHVHIVPAEKPINAPLLRIVEEKFGPAKRMGRGQIGELAGEHSYLAIWDENAWRVVLSEFVPSQFLRSHAAALLECPEEARDWKTRSRWDVFTASVKHLKLAC